MAPSSKDLNIVVQAKLDKKTSLKNLNADLKDLAKELKPLIVKLQFKDDALKALKSVADNIDKINKLADAMENKFTTVQKTIEQLDASTQRITTRKFFDDGAFTQQTEILKEQGEQLKQNAQAVRQLATEYGYLAKEKVTLDTSGKNVMGYQQQYKKGYVTTNQRLNADGETREGNITQNYAVEQAEKDLNALFDKMYAMQSGRSIPVGLNSFRNSITDFAERGINTENLNEVKQLEQEFRGLELQVKSMQEQQSAYNEESKAWAENEKRDIQAVSDEISRQIDLIKTLRQSQQISASDAVDALRTLKVAYEDYFQQNQQEDMKITKQIYDYKVQSINDQIKLIKTLYQTEVLSAQEAVGQLESIQKQEDDLFQTNVDLRTKMMKDMYQIQTDGEKKLAQEEESDINLQLDKIKTLYDTKVLDAKQALAQIQKVYADNLPFYQQNADEELKIWKNMYDMEQNIASDAQAKIKQAQKDAFKPMNHTGFGMGPLNMASMMLQFEGSMALFNNVKQGFVDINQSAAGLQQVFGNQIQTQQQLNTVTDQFVGIAQKYGTSVTDVTDAAKLWGRQYKDVNESLVLTNNSTLLSIVDNLKVADANKAVESSMNAMGMSVNNASQAYQASMKLVDSWSAVSHQASVSATDLTQGFERSAGAAHDAGISIDQLNALVASGVRNTGRSGAVIGNMWKSVFANIESENPKVVKAFNDLGIQMTQTGADGQKSLVPVYDLIVQLSEKAQQAQKNGDTSINKSLEAIAGGKYQFDSLEASIANTKTITDSYTASVTSNGKAQELAKAQMNTVHAELQRLQDAIQKMAYDASNTGFGAFLKSTIGGLTDLVLGLEKIPAPVYEIIGAVTLAVVGLTKLTQAVNAVKLAWVDYSKFFNGIITAWKTGTTATQAQTTALIIQRDATGALKITEEASIATKVADTVATEGLTTATRAGAAAMALLDVESGGLLLVLGLVVAGVAGVAGTLGAMGKSSQDASTNVDTLTQGYAKNKTQVDGLVKSYDDLSKATNNGTTFKDEVQHQQYLTTVQQLSQLMPTLVDHIDAEGQAHLKNADALKQELNYQKQLAQAKNQTTIDNSQADYDAAMKSLQNDTTQYNTDLTDKNKGKKLTPHGWLTLNEQQMADVRRAVDQDSQTLEDDRQKIQQKAQSLVDALLFKNVDMTQDKTDLLTKIEGNIDWNKASQNFTSYQDATNKVAKAIQDYSHQMDMGTNSTQAMQSVLQQLDSEGLPTTGQSFSQLGKSILDASTSSNDFQSKMGGIVQQYYDTATSLSDVNDLLYKYQHGQQVTEQEIMSVVKAHSDLKDKLQIVHGQLVINTNDLQDYIDAQKNEVVTALNAQISDLNNQEKALQQKLQMYGMEIDGINSVADAEKALADQREQQAQNQQKYMNSGTMAGFEWSTETSQTSSPDSALQKDLIQYGQDRQTVNDLMNKLNDPNSWGISNTKVQSGGGSGSALKNATDPFTAQLDLLDAKLNQSKDAMAQYNNTSKEYRAELSKQQDILKQKIAVTQQEIDSLKGTSGSAVKIAQLTDDIAKLNTEITKDGDAWIKSNMQAFFDTLSAKVQPLTDKIKNLKDALDLMNDANPDEQKRIDLTNNLAESYSQQMKAIMDNIQAVKDEQAYLQQNTQAWTDNQTELKKWEDQATQTAQSMKSLSSTIQSNIVSQIEEMKKAELQALGNAQKSMMDNINDQTKQNNNWDSSDWQSQMSNIKDNLDELDGKFKSMPFMDTTDTVRNNLQDYNNQLQQIAQTVDSFQNYSSNDINSLNSNILNEIKYAGQLKDQLADVNNELNEKTLLYKQQENALSQQLKDLDAEYQKQDKLAKLQDIQTQLEQAIADKRFSYINSQGKEILTYNKDTVDKLKDQQDKLLQQFQRDDIKQTLQNELDNMKNIHQQELDSLKEYQKNLQNLLQNLNSDVSDKSQALNQLWETEKQNITDAFTGMEDAVKNGTDDITAILSGKDGKGGWYGTMVNAAKQFGLDFGSQINQIGVEFQQLQQLASQISAVEAQIQGGFGSGGGSSSGGSSGGESSSGGHSGSGVSFANMPQVGYGSTGNAVKQLQQKLGITADGIFGQQTLQAVENYQKKYGLSVDGIVGKQTWGSLESHHVGGIVGGVSSPLSEIVNQLFNNRPDERIIKALVGEVMVPQDNITKNFIPNMQNVAKMMSGVNNSSPNVTTNEYHLHDVVIQTNDAEELFDGIQHLVTSRKK